jgi:hypothetical protein
MTRLPRPDLVFWVEAAMSNDPLLDAIDARLAELTAQRRGLADVDIGFKPHRFQQEIYARRKRFTVVCAHRGSEKPLPRSPC